MDIAEGVRARRTASLSERRPTVRSVIPVQATFDELGTPLRETTFVVVDLETTGGSSRDCSITEIGAVKVRGEYLIPIGERLAAQYGTSLAQPDGNIAAPEVWLEIVRDFCAGHVADVRCAVIYEKPPSVVHSEYVWRRTDKWINFPWSDQPPVATRDWSVRDA